MRYENYQIENTEKKSPWYDWLVKYILEIVKNTVGSFNDKIVCLLKANTTKNYSKPTRAKNLYKGIKV